MNDLLTKNLVYKEVRDIIVPTDYSYDFKAGLWRSGDQLFIHSSGFNHTASKKRDMETGEDQK